VRGAPAAAGPAGGARLEPPGELCDFERGDGREFDLGEWHERHDILQGEEAPKEFGQD
jgi:hypothetical protein